MEKLTSLQKHFAHQYLIKKKLCKKWGSPAVDLAISHLNKTQTVPVNEFPVFNTNIHAHLCCSNDVIQQLFHVCSKI